MTQPSHSEASVPPSGSSRIFDWLKRLVNVEPLELKALIWSFTYFFALLCSYYILRPLRDEMGIAGGVKNLQWLFTGTFLAMVAMVPLFGWIASRYPRKRFLPYIYYFFIANIVLFFVLFQSNLTHAYVARAFFVWVSVFNLFVVSVFWSFTADIFRNAQAKRLFGFIAAGGTAGALTGPALTATLAVPLGPTNLLLISAGLLGWAVFCVKRLIAWRESLLLKQPAKAPTAGDDGMDNVQDQAMGGGILAAFHLIFKSPYLIGICLLMLLYATLATFLYFQQANIIRDHFADSADRTTVFAIMDFTVNALTIIVQLFLTGRIVKHLGLGWTLALIPLLLGIGFLIVGFAPVLGTVIIVQIIRRAGNYAVMRPAREMLYVVLSKQEKYKAKNFIDTAIYRGGDVVSAWAFAGLQALGFTLSAIAFVAVPLTCLWAWIAFKLGKTQEAMANQG